MKLRSMEEKISYRLFLMGFFGLLFTAALCIFVFHKAFTAQAWTGLEREAELVSAGYDLVQDPQQLTSFVSNDLRITLISQDGRVLFESATDQPMENHLSRPEIRQAMELGLQYCDRVHPDILIGTDPDCDRIGAGVRQGDTVTLISGNDMGVLLLDYVCSHRKAQKGELPPVAVKTIVTTEMAVPICKKYGVELRNVLTGFKFIGEQIGLLEKEGHTERYIFGFEESYGYLSGTSVRDKDAVNAAVLVCEMAANYKAQGLTLLDKLEQLREEFGFYAQRLLTFQYEGESGAAKMADIMRKLRAPLDTFQDAHFPTATRIDYQNDETGLPKSDVLSFALADGSKIIVRPSGTEPKLKAYLFARGENQAAAEKVLDELETLMNGYCKE